MDITNLTLGEISTVEELSGRSLSALSDETAPKGKIMAALAYVLKRRQDPKYTLREAEELTMDQVNELFAKDNDEIKK